MEKICSKIEPIDIISMIIIIGGLILKFCGADGIVTFLLTSVVFYYYGKKGVGSLQQAQDVKDNAKL